MLYEIVPVPKPRMTRRDKLPSRVKPARPPVARYWAFKDEVRYRMPGVQLQGSCVVFFMPMPKSWSKAKREKMLGQPHQQKPDLSNLLKALEDALYGDDSHIAHYGTLLKVWSEDGQIMVKEGCRDGAEILQGLRDEIRGSGGPQRGPVV